MNMKQQPLRTHFLQIYLMELIIGELYPGTVITIGATIVSHFPSR